VVTGLQVRAATRFSRLGSPRPRSEGRHHPFDGRGTYCSPLGSRRLCSSLGGDWETVALPPALTREARVTNTRDILDLTNGELCVLRWLRISNGKATISAKAVAANSLFIVPDRLLNAGYVRTNTDQFSPKTVHYNLTESGLEALEVQERRTFFSDLAQRAPLRPLRHQHFEPRKRRVQRAAPGRVRRAAAARQGQDEA
jgi:hypothetical protein